MFDAIVSSFYRFLALLGFRIPAWQFELFYRKAPGYVAEDHIAFLKKARRYVGVSEARVARPRPGPSAPVEMRCEWTNEVKNQAVTPLKFFYPTSSNEVPAIIREAESQRRRVRAIGSGHSFSDVAVTTDYMIDTHGLNAFISLDQTVLKSSASPGTLFEVQAGIRIADLNEGLFRRGLALANMGGYDAQTIVGAASTSTHGSGLTLGPISESIVSMDLVSTGGAVYRIEPADGITDPARFREKYPGIRLVQDDRWFRAVGVSMGCMGVIISVILRVMPAYYLRERRTRSTWEDVKNDLTTGRVFRENRHYEVLVNPYATNGNHTCLVTERNFCDPPPEDSPEDAKHRRFFYELTGLFPDLSGILAAVFNGFPNVIPDFIDQSMGTLVDDEYIDRSYRVLNLGPANHISAYSSEIAFPMKDNRYIDATEHIFAVADQNRRLGEQYHTSPISLRFVRGSDLFLSMQNGGDTCMIEIPMVNGTVGGMEILERLERELYAFGGRPHWGQVNFISGANGRITGMYPHLPEWLRVFTELNPRGTFNNEFSRRCGFSE